LAIELEHRTLDFYKESLSSTADEADAMAIQKILDEEQQHERDLKETRRSTSA